MNSLELIVEIQKKIRHNANRLDEAYNSGLRDAIWSIRESTTGDVEYCPRCAEIAKLFKVED